MAKKLKILIEKNNYEEVEISLPFYAYYQGEGEDIFVKITDKEFKKITFYQYGSCKLFKCKTNKIIYKFAS